MIALAGLHELYQHFNAEYFEGMLPPCKLTWSRALTRAAGNIDVKRREIKLSVPLLVDAFRSDSLFAPEYMVCGVLCVDNEHAVYEILKHEMIHLWLYERGLPHGHTAEFRQKARELGQSKIRHNIALPRPHSGWEYSCAACGESFVRRRRYGRAVACASCCKRHNRGCYDARFKLKGKRLS